VIAQAARRPLLTGAVSLFLLLSLAYSFSIGLRASRGAATTGDEPFYLLTTQSLLGDGDLDLRQQYERESWRSFFDHPDGLWQQMVPLADGSLISPHDPGLSVLIMPGFLLDGLQGVQFQLLFIAALTMSLAFVLAASEAGKPLLCWLVAAVIGLSATPFVYATEVYPEFPAALCLVTGLLLVRSRWRSAVAGVALVALLTALAWLGIKYTPLAAIVAVLFLLRASTPGRLTLLGLGAVSAVVYVWAHYAIFGHLTPYSINTVYEGAPTIDVLQHHVALQDRVYRLWGLFIDRRFGIGHWAPLLLLLPLSLPLLLSRGRIGLGAGALIVTQLLIATFAAITMMGYWFPGRTLVAVLPLTVLPLALLIERLPRLLRFGAAALAGYSVAITTALALAVRAAEVTIAGNPFDLGALPFRAIGPLLPDYRSWTGETFALTTVWLTSGLLATLLIARPELVSTLRWLRTTDWSRSARAARTAQSSSFDRLRMQ
jgi:hypothetical protein